MEDAQIIELYWQRNEKAITETDRKYGKYCRKIAYDILFDRQDMEECVDDAYISAWNSIPPQRPEKLSTYLGKLCRNTAINLFQKNAASKRGGTETDACLDELAEILGKESDAEEQVHLSVLTDLIRQFLARQDAETRKVFVRRYWYMSSVKEIAEDYRLSESNVKVILMRTREKLKEHLIREGYDL